MPFQVPSPTEALIEVAKIIYQFFAAYWWIIFPPALLFTFLDLWVIAARTRWTQSLEWITLEVRIPRGILKTPKSMEQIFTSLHAIYDPPSFIDKWREGRLQEWISFELVGDGTGLTHFYIRTVTKFRNTIESHIYAQYPQSEIVEVEDYTTAVSTTIPNQEFDLWGTEMILTQPNPKPIRLYSEVEEKEDERRIDQMAPMIEVMGRLQPGENIWIQYILKPVGEELVKEGTAMHDKLSGKQQPSSPGIGSNLGLFLSNLMRAPFELPVWEETKPTEVKPPPLPAGAQESVKAIEKKMAKLAFQTTIRWLYIGRRETFNKQNPGSILSFFRQFNTMNLNGFKLKKETMTKGGPWWFPKFIKDKQEYAKKRMIFQNYKMRVLSIHKPAVLNTEELATVYHFPSIAVEAPGFERVEYKKGGPPATLPIAEL